MDAAAGSTVFHGLPPTRAYPIEDIGYVARGALLDFDRHGRLAVILEGAYAVLNDTVWIDLSDPDRSQRHVFLNVIQGADGRAYFGSRESWGLVETGSDGRLRTVSLVPEDPPKWTQTATFDDLLTTRQGVYFASWNGVAYLDFETGRIQCFAVNGISCLFQIGDRVYVSSLEHPVKFIDVRRGLVTPVGRGDEGPVIIEYAADMGGGYALLAETEGRIWSFNGESFSEWDGLTRNGVSGRIRCMQGLVDGGVAIAVVGRGLYLFDVDDMLRTALNLAQYHLVTDMANREAGVLWVATEDTIEKVLYGSPLSTFGQKLGLTVSWPVIERWMDRLFVATGGKLFEATRSGPGIPSRFEEVADPPPGGVWAMAAHEDQMLVGGSEGVFRLRSDGAFEPIPAPKDPQHLVMVGEDLCFAIGRRNLAVLRWHDGVWSEAAPRMPGLVYAPVVHRSAKSVWVEMGGGGVARVWLADGALRVEVFPSEGWTSAPWVNVGVIDDIVILSAARGVRRYFNETTESWCEAPEIEALLDRPSQWIARVRKDERGVIWASHNEGVVAFTPSNGDYVMDAFSFDQINDRFPTVHILAGSDVWITAGQSLHHVEPRRADPSAEERRPVLVSAFDTNTNTELLTAHNRPHSTLKIPYVQNSLAFRMFWGGYGWRRAPVYEYKLRDGEQWTTLDSGSLLSFKGLREGAYQLQVRTVDGPEDARAMATFGFEIRPPWHRTTPAYLLYGILFVVAGAVVVRVSGHLERRRTRNLENLVRERTSQLEATMAKLNEETRNAATLAERNRLAGEIHDSLQQGLSGAILQLDTTLKLPSVVGEIRSRLNVIRNMVSFTRQEVQHAVWDMESPLVEGVDLAEAVRRLTGLINSCHASIEVSVEGTAFALSRVEKHNLLRIAQEAIANAVRHASASQIRIHLHYGQDSVSLAVSDDGVGFDPRRAMDGSVGHFGLRGIRSRARKLRGELSINSSPGSGASVSVVVPHLPLRGSQS